MGQSRLSLREKMSGVATNVYLMKTLEKPKRRWSADFENEGSGVVSHGEGISTPRARHKGRQPLIKCTKHDFKIMYFPFFYIFFMYFPFFIFFMFIIFLGLFLDL